MGCTPKRNWYSVEFTKEEQQRLSPQLRKGGGYFYQGSRPERFQLEEAMMMDSTDADLWRELGTARVKRGLASEMYYYYGEAVKRNPEKWAGFRGYLYLYFYRDYERAIADFNLGDSANGRVDYSQGQSHDYMRGIAYYGLKKYSTAVESLDAYIEEITETEGEDWVDVYAHLYRGLALANDKRYKEALVAFDNAEKLYPKLADVFYHRARIHCGNRQFAKALMSLDLAKKYFVEGYYHQRPYVEVLDQLYLQDIEQLIEEIQSKMAVDT